MSRNRWLVLLGPPLVIAIAASSIATSLRSPDRALAVSVAHPRQMPACTSGRIDRPKPAVRPTSGSWFRGTPLLDVGGTLTGWRLTVGGPDGRASEMSLPPESHAGELVDGRLVVTSDDGHVSRVQIVEAAAGCSRTVGLDRSAARTVARRAVIEPAGDSILVHRLDRATRADLGIVRVFVDGRPSVPVVQPPSSDDLAAAGVERVWSTELRLDPGGTTLEVRSCDPGACLTRIVDLRSGAIRTITPAGSEIQR